MTSLALIIACWTVGVPLLGLLLCLLAPRGRRTSLPARLAHTRRTCQPFRQRSASVRRLAVQSHSARNRRPARIANAMTLPERSRFSQR